MTPRLNPLVVQVRTAPGDKAAENTLAAAVREILVRAHRFHGLSHEDAEDRAQDKVVLVCDHLKAGDVEPGKEEAYVWQAGKRATLDVYRRKARESEKEQKLRSAQTTGTSGGAIGDAGAQPDQPSDQETAEVVAVISCLQNEMPETYRHVVYERYVRRRSIDDIAKEELNQNPTGKTPGKERTLKQARNVIDQRLKRARCWIKVRVATRQKQREN